MHQSVLDVEWILDGSWVQAGAVASNAKVGRRLDTWRKQMSRHSTDGTLCELEQECLTAFLQQLSNLHPRPQDALPPHQRSQELERIGKNWNSYLLRNGRSVAYYEWWVQDVPRLQQLVEHASRLDRVRWRELLREASTAQREQLTRFRFRHKREAFLFSIEERWAAASA